MRLLKQAAMIAALFLAVPVLAIGLAPAAALAQDLASGAALAEPTLVQQLIIAIMPAVGLVITAVLTWAAAELHKRTGITIEARHRDALQSALMNGILFALQRAGWAPGSAITPTIMATARSYVESSVPDALKHFGIDTRDRLGIDQLDRLLTPKLPLPAGTIMPNGDKLIGRAP